MENNALSETLIAEKKRELADSVGEFIKYWGFKEVHGRIWIHIYLSAAPITAKELTTRLGVTKGLVSTALAELIAYQVVEKVHLGDARSSGYQSNTDLMQVIFNILRNRELKLTNRIQNNIETLRAEMDPDSPHLEKVEKLHEMTTFAVDSLSKLLQTETIPTRRLRTLMRLMS